MSPTDTALFSALVQEGYTSPRSIGTILVNTDSEAQDRAPVLVLQVQFPLTPIAF